MITRNKTKIKTVLTLAALALAVFAGPTQAGIPVPTGINPVTGNPWANGDTYRLAFVSSVTTQATSTDINYYNTFLQNLANASSLDLSGATWKVIGSTSTVDARDNTSTNTAVNGTGEAIFLVDGITKIADDYADLWDGNIDHALDMDENGNGGLVGRTHVGTNGNGTKRDRCLGGSTEDPPKVETGEMHDPSGHWLVQYNSPATTLHAIYALSDPLIVGGGGPSIISPEDGSTVPVGDVDLLWENMDPNYPGGPVYVDVWFGTEPNELHPGYDMTQVVTAGENITTVQVSAATEGTYYWQVNSYIYGTDHINEPNMIEGSLWSFYATSDAPPSLVDAGIDMIT